MPVDALYRDLGVVGEPQPYAQTGSPTTNPQDGFFGFYARATYDFSVLGGATGSIYLNCFVPNNTLIYDGLFDVVTAITGAGASFSLGVVGTGDMLASAVVGTNGTAGRHQLIPVGTIATIVKTSTSGPYQAFINITGAALTAGRGILWLRCLPASI